MSEKVTKIACYLRMCEQLTKKHNILKEIE